MFLLQCWSYLRLWRFHSFCLFAWISVEKCKYSFILRITFMGFSFVRQKYTYLYPLKESFYQTIIHSVYLPLCLSFWAIIFDSARSSSCFWCLLVYRIPDLVEKRNLHVKIACVQMWFGSTLGTFHARMEAGRADLTRAHTEDLLIFSSGNTNELRLITWHQAKGDTRKHLCSSQDGTSS